MVFEWYFFVRGASKHIYFLSKTTDSDTNIYILTLHLQISTCNSDQYKEDY